jgi:murein tripeptide amidase MpaA
MIEVSADGLDCGNIEVVSLSSPLDLRLQIRPDVPCVREEGKEHFHWFYFVARNVKGQRCAFKIINAGEASYAWKGWPSIENRDPGFKARVSYDRQHWHQCADTHYDSDSGILTIELSPEANEVFIAAFEPYTAAHHAAFLAEITAPSVQRALRSVEHRVIGRSLDGASIDLVTIPGGPLKIWVLGRQHPGETMGSYFIEGFLRRLVAADSTDSACAITMKEATILAVPHTNPDGGSRGHLRVNAAGANLNREWASPNASTSPEVLCIRNEMDRLGCDLCLDIHGSEGIPRVWATLCTGWTPRLARLCESFLDGWAAVSPDFDRAFCNIETDLAETNLDVCTAQIGHRFGAL